VKVLLKSFWSKSLPESVNVRVIKKPEGSHFLEKINPLMNQLSQLWKSKIQNKVIFYLLLAEVPGAARVNLQPAEHLKNVSFSF